MKLTEACKHLGLSRWLSGKESSCQCRRQRRCGFDPWVRKTPWRRKWQPTPVSLPGKSHGQRSLVGCSPWGRKESGTTERLHYLLIRASLVTQMVKNLLTNAGDVRDVGLIPGSGRPPGEGNSNPPQYPCLENLMDRGTWWIAVHGVAKSRA